MECHSNQKYVILDFSQRKVTSEAIQALKDSKYVDVPEYNAENDTFYFKSGKTIANDDPVFKQYKWL